jgi:hypothetical protein
VVEIRFTGISWPHTKEEYKDAATSGLQAGRASKKLDMLDVAFDRFLNDFGYMGVDMKARQIKSQTQEASKTLNM